jgi:signal peptidase I
LRQETALHGALGLCQRDEILEILEEAEIAAIVLKGAALARAWYGDISLRSFLDIDLWVSPHQLGRAAEALKAAGYEELNQSGKAPHHTTPLHRRGLPCAVELHSTLTRLQVSRGLPFPDLYARSIVLESESRPVRTLGPEDTLLHLCLHLLHHLDYSHGWRLRHLCDIERHVRTFTINWTVFAETARSAGVYPACRAVLGLAALTVGANVPTEHTDRVLAVELARSPIPGVLRHRRRAAFLAGMVRGDLAGVNHLLWTTVAERVSKNGSTGHDARQQAAPSSARPLHRFIVNASNTARWVHTWLPQLHDWNKNEALVTKLLSSSEAGGPRPSSSVRMVPEGGDAGILPRSRGGTSLAAALGLAAVLSVLLREVVGTIRVTGTSMEPTLHSGQRLVTLRRHRARRGTIVVLQDPPSRRGLGVKRIVGLPGETVAVRGGQVWIGDDRLNERYGDGYDSGRWGPATVPAGHYFVLGDNRRTSIDSRTWGWIPEERVAGTVWLSYWPPQRWGFIGAG